MWGAGARSLMLALESDVNVNVDVEPEMIFKVMVVRSSLAMERSVVKIRSPHSP